MIGQLLSEIQQELKKLRSLSTSTSQNIFELTRCMDDSFCLISWGLSKTDPRYADQLTIFKTLSAGFYYALETFFKKKNIASGNFLPEQTSPRNIAWANEVLSITGCCATTERHISLTHSKIFKVKKSKNEFIFKCIIPNIWHEMIDSGNSEWLRDYKYDEYLNNSRLIELESKLDHERSKDLDIFDSYPIQHKSNSSLDEYFLLKSRALCQAMIGYDTIPPESRIGSVKYGDIQLAIQGIVCLALKHLDFCFAYLSKHGNSKVNLWDYYTLTFKKIELISAISTLTGLQKQIADSVVQMLAVDGESIGAHTNIPSASLPICIAIDNDIIVLSLAGALNNPFTFSLRALKFYYQSDFDKAVGNREKYFRDDFYSLFSSDDFVKCDANITLKNRHETLTDIDALIYCRSEKSLLIVQLKWADDFGTSMRQRDSAGKNLYNSSIFWLNQLDKWLANNSAQNLTERIDSKRLGFEVNHVHKLVIGRHIAHFSDQKKDFRAVWCSWPELVRATKSLTSEQLSLNALIERLYSTSPEAIDDRYGTRMNYRYQLGRFRVHIKY